MNKEDIETLEDLKNIFIHLKNYGWVNDIKRDVVADKVIKAIENLIARNKELEIKQDLLKILQDKINEQTIFINEIKNDYIPKSKARELIEKYKGFGWHNKDDEYWANRILDGFEELL